MTEVSYPSTAHNSGSLTETEYEQLVQAYAPDGLVGSPADSPLVFGDTSGLQVKFRANVFAFVRGQLWSADATVTKAIAANSSGSTRVDLLTLRLDRSTNLVTAHVITGTPGSGAPAPVQNAPGSGVWDLPVGTVTVANGASTINAADVKFLGWYLVASTVARSGNFSDSGLPRVPGRLLWRSDQGRMYLDTGSGSEPVIYEDTGWVPATAISGSGWNQAIKFRRLNGVVFTQFGDLTRTGGTLAPSTPTSIATAPAGFRPNANTRWIGYFGGAHLGLGYISPAGTVILTAYSGTTITAPQIITPADISYPSP